MTIQVQYQPTEYVLEGTDFFCQHASTHVESLDYGYADARLCDYVDDWRDTDVCDSCGEELLDD
jgi:hypothetical protein